MEALNRVRLFPKERNLDNLVWAVNFLFAFKHILEICSSNFNFLSTLTLNSFTLLLYQILSSPILTHICSYFVPETII